LKFKKNTIKPKVENLTTIKITKQVKNKHTSYSFGSFTHFD